MKRILALILAILCTLSFVGCNPDTPPVEGTDSETEAGTPSTDTDVKIEDVVVADTGIVLNDEFKFETRNDDNRIKLETEFTMVSDIDKKYVRVDGGINYVSYLAPQFEVGGVAEFDKDGKPLRLPTSVVSEAGNLDIKKHAYDMANGTIRFSTTATIIKVKASFSNIYSGLTTPGRGAVGIEVFTGSGTDREYVFSNVSSKKLDSMAEPNLEREYSLPEGYKEVLILLPKGATVKSFEIGFANGYDGIGIPLERDLAPVVFYGSGITQGIVATKPGITYTALTSRMLNADAINLGFIGDVKGEKAIAEYIAGLQKISALVMEFDNGATLEDLKANHYTFYKTVRDAHPDIPIIIMSDPCFSAKQIAEAAERVAVIADTYNKAVEAGDKKVYFVDGRTIFPYVGNLAELLTPDQENPSDTGMYYIASCIYDIINSAYTPDSLKSGVERKPGDMTVIDFTPVADETDVSTLEYTKIADIASEYVAQDKNGTTYLKFNTPQFELGGVTALEKPISSKSSFFRLEEARAQDFFKALIESANYQSLAYDTSGGTIRFCTDADELVIKAALPRWTDTSKHMSSKGAYGFDVYVGTGTDRVFVCEVDSLLSAKSLNQTIKLPEGFKEVMIDFPLYSGVANLTIGFTDKNAQIAPPTERAMKPICFYGSSITQGCSAARSGLHYPNIVSRMLNADNKGLGFSGSARGEQIMADYIASLDLSIFVMDYDENSGAAELKQNHYNFYKTVRNANPDLPILMLTCPKFTEEWNSDDTARVKAIRDTYEKAIAEGDKNVYIFEATGFFPHQSTMPDIYAADMIHPNTMAMYYMAKAVYETIVDIIG